MFPGGNLRGPRRRARWRERGGTGDSRNLRADFLLKLVGVIFLLCGSGTLTCLINPEFPPPLPSKIHATLDLQLYLFPWLALSTQH